MAKELRLLEVLPIGLIKLESMLWLPKGYTAN